MEEYELENYTIYTNGKVYSKRKNRYLKGATNNSGYIQYYLDGKWEKSHRLVAKCFIPNEDGKTEVNHKDRDKENNDVSNLEWVTHSENIQHAQDNKKWGGRKKGFKVSNKSKQKSSESAHKRWGKLKHGEVLYDSRYDAANKLGVSEQTVYRMIKKGDIVRI